MTVEVKRVYEAPSPDDGYRVLVDRVWPRGLSKEAAHCDEWLRGVGPSAALRRWFGHEDARFDEFASRYRAELAEGEEHEALEALRRIVRDHPVVTLVYGAKNERHNQAVVLRELLRES